MISKIIFKKIRFNNVNPKNFGDLVKLAREYPKRKLIWCEDGYFAPYVD